MYSWQYEVFSLLGLKVVPSLICLILCAGSLESSRTITSFSTAAAAARIAAWCSLAYFAAVFFVGLVLAASFFRSALLFLFLVACLGVVLFVPLVVLTGLELKSIWGTTFFLGDGEAVSGKQ